MIASRFCAQAAGRPVLNFSSWNFIIRKTSRRRASTARRLNMGVWLAAGLLCAGAATAAEPAQAHHGGAMRPASCRGSLGVNSYKGSFVLTSYTADGSLVVPPTPTVGIVKATRVTADSTDDDAGITSP
jgi:hypothetical protein